MYRSPFPRYKSFRILLLPYFLAPSSMLAPPARAWLSLVGSDPKRTLFLWLLVSSLFGCRGSFPNQECPPLSWTLNAQEQAFYEICFGNEFGEYETRLRRWETNVRIFFPRQHPLLEAETRQVIGELNILAESLQLSIVEDAAFANLIVFFGPKSDYVTEYEPDAILLANGNAGLFAASWNPETYIIERGTVCIDIEREPDPDCQRHLLREELTQVLGMMNDLDRDSESIFYQPYTCTIEYSLQDVKFITLFLSNRVRAGMCQGEVMRALF